MRLAAAAFCLLALGMGRRPPEDKVFPATEARMEWKGASCGVSKARAVVVTNEKDWQELWQDAFGQQAPSADFTRHYAVAVFAGAEPTGGWAPELKRLSAGNDSEQVVGWRVSPPPPGAFVTQAFTTPYLIQLLDGDGRKVRLERLD
jgi:hypothetical protein